LETTDGYPGWKPNLNSKTLKAAKETFRDMFHKDPEIKAIHAGLECGIIGEKLGEMDMVSFGPTIQNAHSPDERLVVASVKPFYEFLTAVLKRVAKN
jgi:dipeptidase D